MPFPYYHRLSKRQQAIYRRSAAVPHIPLADRTGAAAFARDLERALHTGSRQEVERSAWRLCRRICQDLGVPWVELRVRQKRPSSSGGELHGLYEREEGQTAVITLWMRTAQQKRVVAFKTFLRTLLHELCHHLDYEVLGLADSMHTEGFFRRESDLARQLLDPGGAGQDQRVEVRAAHRERRGQARDDRGQARHSEGQAPALPDTAPALGQAGATRPVTASGQLALPFGKKGR